MANNGKSPTQEVIDKCKDILCDDIIALKAEKDASIIKRTAREEVEQYKICCFVKAQQAFHTYTSLDLLVATKAKKTVEVLGGNVKKYIEIDNGLAKILSETVKSIKEVKKKLAEVADEACKLDRCVEEEQRCNPDLKKALENGVPRIKEAIRIIRDSSKNCYDLSSRAFDAGVEIVGVQSFTNLESLKKMSDELTLSVSKFKIDIDLNTKKAYEDMTKCKEEYVTVVQELEQLDFDRCTAEVQFKAVKASRDFICDPHCERCDDDGRGLQELCRKVKKNFDDDSQEVEYDCESDDEPGNNRPNNPQQEKRGDWGINLNP